MKDLDLGLEAGRRHGAPLPLASLTRDAIQALIGNGYGGSDFAALILMQARAAGISLAPENVAVDDGLH